MNDKAEKPKCDKEQLAMLKRCSDAKDMTEWNEWRRENPKVMILLQGADLSTKFLLKANLFGANLSSAKLDSTLLVQANLTGANLMSANLNHAILGGAHLNRANLTKASLLGANISGADLNNALLIQANLNFSILSNANLSGTVLWYCQFIRCDLTGACLTGAKIYGTARDDWKIDGVKCDYIYWDEKHKNRTPKSRDFGEGEFEELYKQLPTIEYFFENGFTPLDPLIMDRVVQAIRERNPGLDLKIDSINARGLSPSIRLTVQQEEQRETALAEIKRDYEDRVVRLESVNTQLLALLGKAIDKTGNNYITGSIIATDGSTINITQHVQKITELQKVIATETENSKSFAKVAKDKAMDILGGAAEDVAKGLVKEAAKKVVELGIELGPVLMQTAAYAFFKSLMT